MRVDFRPTPKRVGQPGPRALARCFAVLAVAALAGGVAQAASLTNSFGPRLPTTIGPRAPIENIGPRFSPTFNTPPGGGGGTGVSNTGVSSTGGSSGGSNAGNTGGHHSKPRVTTRRGNSGVPPGNERRYLPDEVVFEVNNLTDAQRAAFLASFRLALLASLPVRLVNTTFYRARILDGSSVPAKIRAMETDARVRNVQPHYAFRFGQGAAATAPAGGDGAQYALAKLHLPEAHALARGDDVAVAVIDSGIDVDHPALSGVVTKSFDALNSSEGPHAHGTAIAGIIAGHAALTGAAPAVHILAARAFSATQGSTMSIIASIDWAAGEGARVVNMSFAGPADPALARLLAAARQKGIVLVAAAGNAGPKSPPLWPAADQHVIAVTATDFDDHLYAMANRGRQIAIAAPGVDILVANPGGAYKMETGTSFSAAFVSGVAALLIQRNPKITADEVQKILLATAHDLGPKGRDDMFGAGLMDALAAVSAVAKHDDTALQVPTR